MRMNQVSKDLVSHEQEFGFFLKTSGKSTETFQIGESDIIFFY